MSVLSRYLRMEKGKEMKDGNSNALVATASNYPARVAQFEVKEDVVDKFLALFLGPPPTGPFDPDNKEQARLALSAMKKYLDTRNWWKSMMGNFTLFVAAAGAYQYFTADKKKT